MAKLLLAEDDQSMRDFLTMALSKAGHDVHIAHNGQDAFNLIKTDQDFDLLLTDIVMPGMDGIELSRHAMAKCPDLKVMFITGFAAVAMQAEKQTRTSQTKLLSKPFHLNDLVSNINTLLAA